MISWGSQSWNASIICGRSRCPAIVPTNDHDRFRCTASYDKLLFAASKLVNDVLPNLNMPRMYPNGICTTLACILLKPRYGATLYCRSTSGTSGYASVPSPYFHWIGRKDKGSSA